MEAVSHLERMGKELKCPICLSLVSSAVSLTCNHIFCNHCIGKSMRSDPTCPICKIPFQRREIRPAPHMDTLVSIYKSMELSSGVNIFVTQTAPPASGHENQEGEDMVSGSKTTSNGCTDIPNQKNQRKKKGKTLKGSLKESKSSNSNTMRPSFPANKRIQVPEHPLQETPTRPANPEGGKNELIKDRTQQNAFIPEDRDHLDENGEKSFSPFFWLRDEEDATEKTTQLTDGDPINGSPADALCFSDIKDSEDEGPCNMTSKDVDNFDSEMFEWTQRPCSPELCSSPMKTNDKECNKYDRVQGKEQKGISQHSAANVILRTENEDSVTRQEETDNIEVILPTSSSPQFKKSNHETGTKRSAKRADKARESIKTKRVKRATDAQGANQDKSSNSGELVSPVEQVLKRGKKVSVENKDDITRQNETGNMEVILPTSSPSQIKKGNHEVGTKRSKKRAGKARESIQKKRVKRSTDEAIGVCSLAQKGTNLDKNSNTVELMIPKEQILKGGKKVCIENEDNITQQKETDNMDAILPAASPSQIKKVNLESGTERSKKRAEKARENIKKKGGKRATQETIEVSMLAQKGTSQDKISNTGELVILKEPIVKRGKKVSIDGKSKDASITKVDTAPNCEKALDHRDGNTVGLVDSLILKEGSSNGHTSNSVGKNTEKTPNQTNKDRARRLKTQYQSNSKDSKTSKKVTFSMNEGLKLKSADGIPSTCENVASKESQPVREVLTGSNVKVKKDSNTPAKTSATFLRKCDTVSDICCAFCQSPEESNLSGPMTHYLNGKPILSDHEGGSKAIHAHRNCAEWAPNVYFEDDIAFNLEAELARSRRIKCGLCGIKGAALGCFEKSCRKSFHFPCAKLTSQCRWDDDNFVMLCPLHASHKLPKETCDSQLEKKKKLVTKRQYNTKQSQAVVCDNVGTPLRWDSRGLFAKIVLCCSALTIMEKETIVRFERLSGVTVLKTWDSRVTHVIASVDENGACRRTLKYLMGILEGKWILTIEWIKACMEVKAPVDEQLYEINVDIHGVRGGPQLGRFRLLNKEPKLFNGYKFYFNGDFEASYKGYLHDLIIAAGGTVLHRKPIPMDREPQLSGHTNPLQFLIYSLELPENCSPEKKNLILSSRKSDAEALARSSGAMAVSNSWVLNSIAACKLQNVD